jgi:HJR/Mrr/RecB family endonuclease
MKRSKETEAYYATQEQLWERLDMLIAQLLEEGITETDDQIVHRYNIEVADDDEEYMADAQLDMRLRDDLEIVKGRRYGDYDDVEKDPVLFSSEYLKQLLISLHHYISNRDIDGAKDTFVTVEEYVGEARDILDKDILGGLADMLGELDTLSPHIIYLGSEEEIKSPGQELLLDLSVSFARLVARNPDEMLRLTPRQFEELIAEVFRGFGYWVELTAQTRDGGRDIVAVRSDHGVLSKLLIECKRFSRKRPVGLSYVHELYAVKTFEHATKAILATTSYFTKDARHLERQYIYELELKDYQAVAEWTKQYSAMLDGLKKGYH